MPKFVGFIFAAIAGLASAAWLYGGSTWGPGFSTREAAAQGAPQFKLSSDPPAAKPADPPATAASEPPAQTTSGAAPPPSTETAAATPAYNTGGNPNLSTGASPNWGLGYGVGKPGQ